MSAMLKLELGVSHTSEPVPALITMLVNPDLSATIAQHVADIEGGGANQVLPVPLTTVAFFEADGSASPFQPISVELALSRRRFRLQGVHPDSSINWSSSTGWIKDIVSGP